MSERYGDVWVCQDCYFAHHYGAHQHGYVCKFCCTTVDDEGIDETDGDCCWGDDENVNENEPHVPVALWYAGEDDEPVGGWHEIHHNHSLEHNREPLWALEGFETADNTCSNHNGDDEQGCSECGHEGWEDGIRDFSWSACDGCHSPLGGSRYRLSLWKREEVTDGIQAST